MGIRLIDLYSSVGGRQLFQCADLGKYIIFATLTRFNVKIKVKLNVLKDFKKVIVH